MSSILYDTKYPTRNCTAANEIKKGSPTDRKRSITDKDINDIADMTLLDRRLSSMGNAAEAVSRTDISYVSIFTSSQREPRVTIETCGFFMFGYSEATAKARWRMMPCQSVAGGCE